MKKYNTIIVDDEKGARESLAKMVEKDCPQIEVVAKADSMLSAYSAITSFQPDLVFLDIEMPNGNAFDLLEKLGTVEFELSSHYSFHKDYGMTRVTFFSNNL